MLTREEIAAIVVARMVGSAEPERHTHIECNCPGLVHRVGEYETKYWEGCYCPACASVEAVKRGLDANDIESEIEGPDDIPQWCENCGKLITLRTTPDVLWGISPDGALEALEHFESGLGADRGEPKTPDDWRLFLLLVDDIAEEHLPRVEALLWSRPSPVSIERIAAIIGAEIVRRGLSVAIGPLESYATSTNDVVLCWGAANAVIMVDAGAMANRVLSVPMAERILAKLTTMPVVVRRTRYWLLDLLDAECIATTGHHVGLRKWAFHPWKGPRHDG